MTPPSEDDFQGRNLVTFQFEEESKVNGAPGKVSGESAGNDSFPVLLFTREWLARVFVLIRSIALPLLYCSAALVGLSLVLHDRIFSEALGKGLAVTFVRSEVGSDGLGAD